MRHRRVAVALVKGSNYESSAATPCPLAPTHLALPCSRALTRPLIRDGCLEKPKGLHPFPADTELKRT